MSRDEREPISDEALDRLLAEARWPVVGREAVERARESWRQERRPRRNVVWWSAAVTGLAASVLVTVWVGRNGRETKVAVSPVPPAVKVVAAPRVREPNVLETMVAMRAAARADVKFVARATMPVPFDQTVEPLFAQLAAPRVPDRSAAATQLANKNDPAVTRRLIAMLPEPGTRRAVLTALVKSREPSAQRFVESVRERDLTMASLIRSVQSEGT